MLSRPSRIAGSEARAMRNCASDEMQVSGFPTSCATPAASRPAAASRSERTICSCSLRSDVTSFTTARTSLTSPAAPLKNDAERSEEHTSELQSHHDLVCRLLLEN